jgi:hypothetical protein
MGNDNGVSFKIVILFWPVTALLLDPLHKGGLLDGLQMYEGADGCIRAHSKVRGLGDVAQLSPGHIYS